MISAELRVGRLLEIVFKSPIVPDDVLRFEARLAKIFREAKEPLVACSDLSGCSIMAPEMADQMIRMFRRDNPKLERNAGLLPPNRAGLRLQIERMVRAGEHPNRRPFFEVTPLLEWLDEALNPEERVRVREFLAEHLAPAGG